MSTSQQDVIKNFMKSLDSTSSSGKSAVDAAVKYCSNSKFSSAQAVINQMVSDCKKASSVDDFLTNYCGIVLDNSDTGAVSGSDMGGSQVKTAESIVPESGSLKSFTGNSFSTNGLNFQLSYVDDDTDYDSHAYDRSYYTLSSSQRFIWQGLYTWWGSESLKLIANSYGSNYGFSSSSSASVNDIHVGFYNSSDNVLAYVSSWTSENGVTVDLDLMVNMYYYDNVDTSDKNGSTSSAGVGYLDRTIAHEFTHAVMGANITNFGSLPAFIKEGMAELTHGIDDERYYDIRYLAGSSSALSSALNVYSDTASSSYEYAGGYMFLHYLAKQLANDDGGDDTIQSSSKFTQGADYYKNTKSNVTLKALGGNDTVNNYGANNVKVYGNADNDSLLGSGNKVTLSGDSGKDYVRVFKDATSFKAYGGTGNDTIDGGGTKSTLNGGSGNDKFIVYLNDVRTRVNGDSGNDYVLIYNGATRPTVSGGSGKDTIYSGAARASLSGGTGNDYFNIYYDSTYPTINGGTGNDTITNYSSSKTTYVYKKGDGKDVISGFNFGTDRIKLTSGSITKKSYSGDDVILTVGTGSIRIKNGRGQKITVIDAKGKTKTYKVGTARSNVSELWFDKCVEKNSTKVYGESLSNITNSVVKSSSSAMIGTDDDLTSAKPPTPTGPITPTKYVIYADENKI